jgi:iron complex transport system substrate-binding protein
MDKITDIRGIEIILEKPAERVVSLVPSLTETVHDLGCLEKLIGCTSYCVQPEGVLEQLKTQGGVIGGPIRVDVNMIRALRPDIVIAGLEENSRADVQEIEKFCPVYTANPVTIADVCEVIHHMGVILDAKMKAIEWVEWIEGAVLDLLEFSDVGRPKRFGYLVWGDPCMVAGGDTYISHLLEHGPLVNGFRDRRRYPEIPIEELGSMDLDYIFLPSEPCSFDEDAVEKVKNAAGKAKVREVDGQMCGWYGTRTMKGLEYIVSEFHS